MLEYEENEKLYKGHYFFIFYYYDDETVYDIFPNTRAVVEKLKKLKQFPPMLMKQDDGTQKWVDVNNGPITRKEVNKISHYLFKCIRKEKHLCTLFGRKLRVYLIDNDKDEDDECDKA